jgi:hypothetical protein
LTWDEFFERTFVKGKPTELTKVEVADLKRLVAEGRPWKTRA